MLEEAPARPPSEESDFPFQILCISGRGKAALEANSQALAAHLRAHPGLPLADVAFTLEEGRRGFEKRRVLVAETTEEAAELLETGDPLRVFTHDVLGDAPEVVFMFPGGGRNMPGWRAISMRPSRSLPSGWIAGSNIFRNGWTMTSARSGCPKTAQGPRRRRGCGNPRCSCRSS
ncbi:hypothetical protein ACFOHS_00605 [Jhaorihella thermophila]